MIPNLDFIRTMLNGIAKKIEDAMKIVESKIHVPDYNASEGEDGYIKNKPTLIGWSGTGTNSAVFNNPENIASGSHSHAEGTNAHATGDYSHAEGNATRATSLYSHAEGYNTRATGWGSHAEGYVTTASGLYSHAEGNGTAATGGDSHAEGNGTKAQANASHAEGCQTLATGWYSHAEGLHTQARGQSQHVEGEWNIEDAVSDPTTDKHCKYIHIAGNGTSKKRSNAHTLDWNGNAWFAGKVFVGGTSQDDPNAIELGAGGGGSGGVRSWNDLRDRPFGSEFSDIPEMTVEFTDDAYYQETPLGLIVDGRYTVTWNGTTYECTAIEYTENGMTGAAIGDVGLMTGGTSTGEPFVIVDLDADTAAVMGMGVAIMSMAGDTSATFSIEGEIISTIDKKYLPKHLRFGTEGGGLTELYPETEISAEMPLLPDTVVFEDGKTYIVTFNGTAYECEAFTHSEEGMSAIVVGNTVVTGVDNGIPFVIMYAPALVTELAGAPGFGSMIELVEHVETFTMQIIVSSEVTVPIDIKYLPKQLQFSTTEVNSTILPRTVLDNDATIMDILTRSFGFIKGEEYRLTVNGVSHMCKAYETTFLSGSRGIEISTPDGFTVADIYPEYWSEWGDGKFIKSSIGSWESTDVISIDGPSDVNRKPMAAKYLSIINQKFGDTLYWDGDTTGRDVVHMQGLKFVRVSDKVLTIDDFANGFKLAIRSGESVSMSNDHMRMVGSIIYHIFATFFIIATEDGADLEGTVFPKKGIYFMQSADFDIESLTIVGYTGFIVEKIDPRYIPGRGEIMTLSTDLADTDDGNGYPSITLEELSEAAEALNNGTKVYGTFMGKGVEVIYMSLDPVDNFHRIAIRTDVYDIYTIRYPFYDMGNRDYAPTPAVDRSDIILRATDDSSKRFRITVNSSGTLTATEIK